MFNVKTALSALMAFRQAGNVWDNLQLNDKDRVEAIIRTFGQFPIVKMKVPEFDSIMNQKDVPLVNRITDIAQVVKANVDDGELSPDDDHLIIKCKGCGDLYPYDLPKHELGVNDMVTNVRVGKQLMDQFASLSNEGKSLFEPLIGPLFDYFLEGEEFDQVKAYLLNKKDSLQERALGAFLYPGVRETFTSKLGGFVKPKHYVPESFHTTCVFCGFEEHIST